MNNKEYDVVIIGAGNGGLIAATTCANYGLKTLLIEQHNLPGGFATSFVRGRFEFEVALHELGNLGNYKIPGGVYQLFKELNINIDWKPIPEAFCLFYENKQYDFSFDEEGFIASCEKYEPGCAQTIRNFLDICKDCYEAVQYIMKTKGKPDSKILKKLYPNYLTTTNSTLRDVTNKLKCSKFIKFILEAYWVYLGISPNNLSATLYCIMFYEYIKFHAYIPADRSHEISVAILERFYQLKGDAWFNTKALKIKTQNNKVIGLETTNGFIKTKHIIANVSPNIVYGKMINQDEIPEISKKLSTYRKPGQQGFCIYLGLDISVEQLGLDKYSYFVFNESDHDLVYQKMQSISTNLEYVLVALNVANPNCSPKGTSILSITTFYEDCWNDVNELDYFKTKNHIAKLFINDLEKRFNIDIKSHIEEIEIATPITFARYTGALNGAIYGFNQTIEDSNYVRSRNVELYDTISGLRFCGAHSWFSHGYSITYISGNIVALKTLVDIKEGNK